MRTQRGSALTEVLVAVFIVTLLVLSIAAVSPMSTRMPVSYTHLTLPTISSV